MSDRLTQYRSWFARGKRWGSNILLITVATMIAFLVGELLVRLIAPQQLILKRPDIWEPAEGLGWRHSANAHTTINTGERDVILMTDKDGYRIGKQGRTNSQVRILLLGDSLMEALQVEYEDSFAGLLEQELASTLSEPVTVRNTAVAGWSPNQYYLQAEKSLAEEHFDLVLLAFYFGNDIIEDSDVRYPPRTPTQVHPFRVPQRLSRKEIIHALLYPLNDALEVRSHLFILAKTRLRGVLMRFGLTVAYFPSHFLKSTAAESMWGCTAEVLAKIEKLAGRREIPMFVMLIPTQYQVDERTFQEYLHGFGMDPDSIDLNQPNQLIGQRLAAATIPFLDLTTPLRKASGELQVYGAVDRHFTAQGHRVAMRAVAPILADMMRNQAERNRP